MRLLQRYILLELLRVFFALLSGLTVVLVFVGVFREARESGLGPFQILQILPYVVPSLLPFTIPATLLLTVCVVYGRIAGDHEITAAKAAGINVLSLLWPAFLLGGAMTVCSFILTDRVIPWAVHNIQRKVTLAMEDIFLDVLHSQHYFTNPRRGFSVHVRGIEGKRLISPIFRYQPPGRSPVTMQAEEATLDFDLEQQQVNLHLIRGQIDIPGSRTVWFEREDYPFPLPLQIQKPKPRHLSIVEIRDKTKELESDVETARLERDMYAAMALTLGDFQQMTSERFITYESQLKHGSKDLAKLETEIHSRFAMACSCFFFVLFGGPFAILQGRKQFLTSFFMCFLPILLIYYPVVLLMMNLSKTNTVSPVWAMWVGNLVMCMAGAVTLRKVLQH